MQEEPATVFGEDHAELLALGKAEDRYCAGSAAERRQGYRRHEIDTDRAGRILIKLLVGAAFQDVHGEALMPHGLLDLGLHMLAEVVDLGIGWHRQHQRHSAGKHPRNRHQLWACPPADREIEDYLWAALPLTHHQCTCRGDHRRSTNTGQLGKPLGMVHDRRVNLDRHRGRRGAAVTIGVSQAVIRYAIQSLFPVGQVRSVVIGLFVFRLGGNQGLQRPEERW